jgi:hypothetical protein
MSAKQRLIAALVRIYPAQWRCEYGAELADLLSAEPLTARATLDVALNGVRQRLRSLELSTLLGLVAMLGMLALFVWNVAGAQSWESGWTTILEPSNMTFPAISIRPLKSELYVLFLVVCGAVIHLRYSTTPARTGLAAMKISFIAGLPILAAGVLMLLGVMHATVLGPGDAPTTFREHGFAFTYYSAQPDPPAALSVLFAPVARLGESWIWGAVGGSLGRAVSRRRDWFRRVTSAGAPAARG